VITIFRKNDVLNFFLLLPYAVVLRLYSLWHPQPYTVLTEDTIVTQWLFSLLESPLLQSIIAIILVFGQAILINVLANNHRLHRLPTALAGMIYILMVSCIKEFQVLTPALIGLTFILISIFNVFNTYKLANASASIFNATFSGAVATILYPPYAVILFALFVGFAMIRNFSAKERIQFLIGFGVLFWIVGAFLFFFNILDWGVFENITMPGALFDFWQIGGNNLWYSLGVAALLIFISLLNYYNYMKKKVIDIRKKIDFFYWLMLSSFLSLLFFKHLSFQHYLFPIVSLSIFLSMSVLLVRNKALVELLHLVLVGIILYSQFIGLFL